MPKIEKQGNKIIIKAETGNKSDLIKIAKKKNLNSLSKSELLEIVQAVNEIYNIGLR